MALRKLDVLILGSGGDIPPGAEAFYNHRALSATEAILEQVRKLSSLSTVRSSDVNVVQTSNVGAVPITYPQGVAGLDVGVGDLIQDTETNQFQESNDFTTWSTQTGGTGTDAIVTPNFAIAPDGTMTATRLQMSLNGGTASGDFSRLRELLFTTTIGQPYTENFFIKSNDTNVYVLGSLIASQTSDGTFTAGSDWTRQSVTQASVSSASNNNGIQIRGTFGHSDTVDVLIWNAGFVNSSFPSSPIFTTGAPGTRIADNSTILTDFFPTSDFKLPISFEFRGSNAVDGRIAVSGIVFDLHYDDANGRYELITALGTVVSNAITPAFGDEITIEAEVDGANGATITVNGSTGPINASVTSIIWNSTLRYMNNLSGTAATNAVVHTTTILSN